MKIKTFFKFVEIQTKVASLIPFIIGILFTTYRYDKYEPILLLLFFISMISIDLATTAINNFMDYKRDRIKKGYNYEKHNAMVSHKISDTKAIRTIIILLIIGISAGLYLFYITNIIVLIIGFISFIIGIFYSYGPYPISRTPFGEVFSGIFMGGIIFFITIYIQIPEYEIIYFSINTNILQINFNYKEILTILTTSLPFVFMISNIMLANNICDLQDDIKNNRFTLPYYIGNKKSLIIFNLLQILSYLVIITLILFKVLPFFNIFVVVTLIPIIKNTISFNKFQIKEKTFSYSVKNFIIFSVSLILTFILHFVIPK